MSPADLIAKVLARRETWVDLEPGKRVRVRRPAEAEMHSFRRITPEQVLGCCVGWDGFSEADVLDPSIASSDPAEFSVDLWKVVALDRMDWIELVSAAVVKAITDHIEKRKETGNV